MHLDNIRNTRYKKLLDLMRTIFYAYSMDAYEVHVKDMYNMYWGAFWHKDTVMDDDGDESFYEDEETYKKFLLFILERTMKECKDVTANNNGKRSIDS